MKNPLTHILRSLESKLLKFGLKAVLSVEEKKKKKMEQISPGLVFVSHHTTDAAEQLRVEFYGEVDWLLLDNMMEVTIVNKRVTVHTYNVHRKHLFIMETQGDADALYESLSRKIDEHKNPPNFDVDKLVNTLVELDDLLGGIRLNFPTK